jgi:transposase
MEQLKINYLMKGGVKMNISELARILSCSWSTAKNKLYPKEKIEIKRKSLLDDYKEIIIEKRDKYLCSAKSIYTFIKERGYQGSYETVKKFVKEYKNSESKKAVLRVLNNPGLQAQVDWKESMKLISKNGEIIEFNIFLYILPYSKYKYIELTENRTQITLFKCIINAFKFCNNSYPDEIWFDNMKTVVKEHNIKTGETIFNNEFLNFSRDIGFKPIACRPYRPQTKGAIENVAKIMDRLKVYNNEIKDLNDINNLIIEMNKSLNEEISQATNKKPIDQFEKEKEYLNKITNFDLLRNYECRYTRKVSKESNINYNGNKYSVPTMYIGKIVEIDFDNQNLLIYYHKNFICKHKITNNLYNYRKEDLIQVMKSDVYKNKSDEEIDKLAEEHLASYQSLGQKR